MRLILPLILALTIPAAIPALADQPAHCEITHGAASLGGPCRFELRKGGSFDVRLSDGMTIAGSASLSLDITAKGRGTVRAGATDWGAATRDTGDAACWKGDGFALCVRAADAAPASTGADKRPTARPATASVFAGRCHMDTCTWVDQPPARDIGTGSAAIPGRLVETTQRITQSEHMGGEYPATAPPGLDWSAPQPMRFFCSSRRPAVGLDNGWTVLPLPDVYGATEAVTQMYLRACHPGAGDDPYEAPARLGYQPGQPSQDEYPDFDALIRP
ncbi:MAG: hypothetical protein Q4G25_15625 [Paracoccus sp. (in: a-proteobacteria)]|nr:hypothetical protein [Paracoccus sp. (in: a-proteobacteria)]